MMRNIKMLDENLLNRNSFDYSSFFDENIIKTSNESKKDSLSLFVSFDICNSTQLKTQIPDWSELIKILYERDNLSYLKKWKHIGDEVVYVGEYIGFKQLIDLIDEAYHTLNAIEKQFKVMLKSLHESINSCIDISLKGTIWLAHLCPTNTNNNGTIHIEDIDEYIGPDIDEGFRMATKTSENKLLIDPKIVYIVLFFYCFRSNFLGIDSKEETFIEGFITNHLNFDKDIDKEIISKQVYDLFGTDFSASPKHLTNSLCNILKNIHFLHFTPLKGIWNEKPYPIFWYFNDLEKCKYYEIDRTDYYPLSIYSLILDSNVSKMYYSSRDLLNVFETVGFAENIKDIINIALKPEDYRKTSLTKRTIANFYYTVACIKEQKVLVLRRKENRRHLGNVWEFFVSKHTNINTKTEIENSVEKFFGIKINLLTDKTTEENIIPIHFCTVFRTQKKHNSILCCAEISGNESLEDLENSINFHIKNDENSKYSEARFIGLDEINDPNFIFEALSQRVISFDAEIADTEKSHPFLKDKNYSAMYFKDSIKAVITFFSKYKRIFKSNFEWWKIYE